jgi:hypothetical protein
VCENVHLASDVAAADRGASVDPLRQGWLKLRAPHLWGFGCEEKVSVTKKNRKKTAYKRFMTIPLGPVAFYCVGQLV